MASMHILRSFDNYLTANLLLQRIQNEGISAYLKDEYTVTIDPLLSNAIGGIKLMVDEKDLLLAQQIIKELDDTYRQSIACPTCAYNTIEEIYKPGSNHFMNAILSRLFKNYTIAPVKMYQCSNCGYEMKQLPELSE